LAVAGESAEGLETAVVVVHMAAASRLRRRISALGREKSGMSEGMAREASAGHREAQEAMRRAAGAWRSAAGSERRRTIVSYAGIDGVEGGKRGNIEERAVMAEFAYEEMTSGLTFLLLDDDDDAEGRKEAQRETARVRSPEDREGAERERV